MKRKEAIKGARVLISMLFASVLVTLVSNGTWNAGTSDYNVTQKGIDQKMGLISSASPISVYENDGFASVPGISGNGSANNPYIIENHVINSSGTGSPINIDSTDAYLTIRNCTVSNAGSSGNDAGIMLHNVMNVNVSGNVMIDNPRGIVVEMSSYILVEHNNISQSSLYGIFLWDADFIMITGNNASQNGQRGIFITASSVITISGNHALNNDYGIDLGNCNDTIVSANNASNNNLGIQLYNTNNNNNTISGNIVLSNIRGIQLQNTNNSHVSGNDAFYNTEAGIYMHASFFNSISANNVSLNDNGIWLVSGSNENDIMGNDVLLNTNNGITLSSSSNGNTISFNNASQNTANGLYIDSSNDNQVLSNVFIQNGGTWVEIWNGAGNGGSDNLCPLGQVQDLVVVPGIGHMTLSWTAPDAGWSRVLLYNVYRGSSFSGPYVLAGTNDSTTGCIDTGLANGQTCYYKVAAFNSLGEGANATAMHAKTYDTPGECSDLAAVASDRSLALTWVVPTGGEGDVLDGGSPITGYNLFWSTDNVTFTKITLGNVTAFLHSDLVNGQAYYYKVSAFNAVGEGLNSTVISAKPQASTPQEPPSTIPGSDPLALFLVSSIAILAIVKARKRLFI